jgi:uncharacterized protein (DUF1786 family)
MNLAIATNTRARVQAAEYALLYNAANGTWSVLVIDGDRVAVVSMHRTKHEAERQLARHIKEISK